MQLKKIKLIFASTLIALFASGFATSTLADDNEMVRCRYSSGGQETDTSMTSAECKQKDGKEVKIKCVGTKDGKAWDSDTDLAECSKKGGKEAMVKCKGKTDGKEWTKETTYDECKRLDGSEVKVKH